MNKICNKCNTAKDLSKFNKDRTKKDGHEYTCKECKKIYLLGFKEELSIRKRKYRLKNKESIKIKSKNYYINNREKMLISTYYKNDKLKNLNCDLTEEWLKENITNKECYYCGDTKNLGCDRIDNTIGHTKNNCIPCCPICNRVRLNIFSVNEMKKIGSLIKEIKQERLK